MGDATIANRKKRCPLILLPGLNGDPRIFAPQSRQFSAVVPRWLPPGQKEALADYARRLAVTIDLHQPCVIGGVSFGGIVAIEFAQHLDARACLVIASARDPSGLPTFIRCLRPLASVLPVETLEPATRAVASTAGATISPMRRRMRRLMPDEIAFRRWAFQALLRWKPVANPRCPVIQIHGDRDNDFPAGQLHAEHVIAGAGHLLTLTHAEQVNAIIHRYLHSQTD